MLESIINEPMAQTLYNQTIVLVIGAFTASYLIWRLWSFTIKPFLQPDEPSPLPYWIPFLGHTYYFMTNPDQLFKLGYVTFPKGEPFTLRLGSKKMIILTSNRDVVAAWKDTAALTFDPFVQQLMTLLGMSKTTRNTLYREEPEEFMPVEKASDSLLLKENPLHQAFYHLQMEWVKQQLSGNMLAHIGNNFMGYINQSLHMDNFSSGFVYTSTPHEKTVSLKKMVRYCLVSAATKAFFGPQMQEVDPRFLEYYFSFEEAAWKMFYQYPRFLAKDLYGAAEGILSTMTRYYDRPQSSRPDTVWMFKTIEEEMRHLSLPSRDIAIMSFMLFWGSNNNAHIICFWTISHILTSPTLLASIRAETSRACSPSGTVDVSLLTHECPNLDATWHEVLRLYTAVSLVRVAVRPTTLSNKTINTGDQVMAPFRQFHLNRELFGEDALEWNPDRFRKDKTLSNNKGYHPFGGGNTYCPGRFLAKQEVYTMVALMLYRFDMEPEDVNMPTVNEAEPSLGAMRPIGDIRVKIRERNM